MGQDLHKCPIELTVGITSEITRYGVEWIARQVPFVTSVRSYDSARSAVDATAREAAGFLILPLSETLPAKEDPPSGPRDTGPKVLSLVDVPNVDRIAHAFDAYHDGFLSMRDFTVTTLTDAIVRVQQGEIPVPPELTRALLTNARTRAQHPPRTAPVQLTRRETRRSTCSFTGSATSRSPPS
jgi:DNA-binding NarL/FixJ family response regulator